MISVSVVIGYRATGDPHRDASYQHTLSIWHRTYHEVIVVDPPGDVYSRAAAHNHGAERATGSVIIFANPDVLLEPFAVEQAVIDAYEHHVTVYPFDHYRELTKACTAQWIAGHEACTDTVIEMPDSVGPALVCRCDRYQQVGGMDERFIGWGFEDVAWSCASAALLGPNRRTHGEAIHLWHAPAPHSWAHKDSVYDANFQLCKRYTDAAALPPPAARAALEALQTEHR